MANVREAIENVRSLSRVFQSVIDLAGLLDDVENINQTITEKQSVLVGLKHEAEKAIAERDSAFTTASAAAAKADQAEESAARFVEEAKKQAGQIVDYAKARADEIIGEANDKAEAVKTAALSAALEQETRRNLLCAEVVELEDRLADAQAKIKKLLGGGE